MPNSTEITLPQDPATTTNPSSTTTPTVVPTTSPLTRKSKPTLTKALKQTPQSSQKPTIRIPPSKPALASSCEPACPPAAPATILSSPPTHSPNPPSSSPVSSPLVVTPTSSPRILAPPVLFPDFSSVPTCPVSPTPSTFSIATSSTLSLPHAPKLAAPFTPTTPPSRSLQTPPPSTPLRSKAPSAKSIANKIADGHARVKASPFYLAQDDFREKVEWKRIGSGNRLLLKRDPDDDAPAEYAVLCCIARICSSSYFLTSDAGYKGPTRYIKRLADAKATALLEAPGIEPFDAEFKAVTRNLQWLQQSIKTPGFNNMKGLFFDMPEGRCFRIRHVLFEENEVPLEAEDLSDHTVSSSDIDEMKDIFTIAKWPVGSQAISDLEDIKSTHTVDPIPAFDMHGELIHPTFYRNRLQGALVELYFTLSHWSIAHRGDPDNASTSTAGGGGDNTYVADLVKIRVLEPPKGTAVTPRKRPLIRKDTMMSPSKRVRI